MDRRERLMKTLRGESVDRPAVCFYEINGYDEHPENPDAFNIYAHPSWKPLIELARDFSDRIVMRSVPFIGAARDPLDELAQTTIIDRPDGRITIRTVKIAGHTLSERARHDHDVNTVWYEEHLLKDAADVRALLTLPLPNSIGTPDIRGVLQTEADLGSTGIVMLDTADPLCMAASLFSMADYTILALKEPDLFQRLLDRFAATLIPQIAMTARALPGRLWRIYGPEYASPPYLPPRLFNQYVVSYVTPMVAAIQNSGGFARIHCHGKLKAILDAIASTGCTALDPIEPPPQGDVDLAYVNHRYGQQMVLFGNLEASDLELLPASEFEGKIRTALEQGTHPSGRGFVLMPSACPYGRVLPKQALANYRKMVELVTGSR